MIEMDCPRCGKHVSVVPQLAGSAIDCPHCRKGIRVPNVRSVEELNPHAPPQIATEDPELTLMSTDCPNVPKHRTKLCPGCDREIPDTAEVCPHCAYNFKTGSGLRGAVNEISRMNMQWVGPAVKTAVLLGLLGAIVYGGWYAFTHHDAKALLKKISGTNEEPNGDEAGLKPTTERETIRKQEQRSLLVVRNERFPEIEVYLASRRKGTVKLGQEETFQIALEKQAAPLVSFEPRNLHASSKLPLALKNMLDKGLPFEGDTKTGMRILLQGPPADLLAQLPKSGDAIPAQAFESAKPDPIHKAMIQIPELRWYELLLKPAYDSVLRLNQETNRVTGVARAHWVSQEVIVERDGRALYHPERIQLYKVERPAIKWEDEGPSL